MVTRTEIVAEARRWIGTPYQHQAHTKAAGCDCAGLVAGVAVAIGVVNIDWWNNEGLTYAGYGRQPANGLLERICDGFMSRVDSMQPGDVVGIRWGRETQHLAIVVPYQHGGFAMIHALESNGCVIEHRINDVWMKRITSIWQMPGVE